MFKHILVPVDLSHEDIGQQILSKAGRLLSESGTITALHVTPDIPAYAEAYVPPAIRDARVGDQHAALTALADAAGIKTVTVRIAHGPAHVRILDTIEEIAPDLVIVGSHKPGLSDYFLGSTAARVVRHAACSVLVDR
ncbi:MAG: universal stress protein [Pseudomonadota bacterium]